MDVEDFGDDADVIFNSDYLFLVFYLSHHAFNYIISHDISYYSVMGNINYLVAVRNYYAVMEMKRVVVLNPKHDLDNAVTTVISVNVLDFVVSNVSVSNGNSRSEQLFIATKENQTFTVYHAFINSVNLAVTINLNTD